MSSSSSSSPSLKVWLAVLGVLFLGISVGYFVMEHMGVSPANALKAAQRQNEAIEQSARIQEALQHAPRPPEVDFSRMNLPR
jgi:uncharacterized protein HemX